MLRVAICDDSALERDILADFLSHYCNAHAIDYSCKMYDSGEPLYYELGDGGWFDIILLDILMDPPLGIDVARRLREIGYKGTIVFCTAALDFAPDSFEVGASGYLLKPYTPKTFERPCTAYCPISSRIHTRSRIVRRCCTFRAKRLCMWKAIIHSVFCIRWGKRHTHYIKSSARLSRN